MLVCVCWVIDHRMTSNCDKNKKVVHEALAECVTDVLTTAWRHSVIYYWTDTQKHGIYLFYILKIKNFAMVTSIVRLSPNNLGAVPKYLKLYLYKDIYMCIYIFYILVWCKLRAPIDNRSPIHRHLTGPPCRNTFSILFLNKGFFFFFILSETTFS